jgi:hypothetical protein
MTTALSVCLKNIFLKKKLTMKLPAKPKFNSQKQNQVQNAKVLCCGG